MVRLFLFTFLLLVGGITLTSSPSFFRTAVYEEGDDAANALQIHRAKHFEEIHGNYSRWAFHHPGPAYFYAYALGEWLLHDVTHLAPAPRNAHIYTGVLLQLAFFAAALALFARHTRAPLLALGLALGVAAWRYASVDGAIYSVWPPHVLLMPFLCFLVACAAVAAGDRAALPLFVLAGGFLVHGHIAQPLFVGPMGLGALVLAARKWRGRWREIAASPAGVLSMVLAALFLLPLVLDLFAGRASNAYAVWLHIKYQSDHGKSLFKSLLCYGSYFLGMNDPTMFNRLTATTHVPFVRHAGLLAGWLITLAASAWYLLRRRPGSGADDVRFGRLLLGFWVAASALTLVWGMRQDGGFTNFNSHFNHSLVFAVALIAIVALTHVLPPTPRALGLCVVVASAIAFVVMIPYEVEIGTRGDDAEARMRSLLDADPRPAAPKLLVIDVQPDRVEWYEAVTAARALQRRGIPFYVTPDWQVMFGADRVFANQGDLLDHGGLSIWRIVRHTRAPRGAHELNSESSVVFVPPAQLAAFPLDLSFARGTKPPPFAIYGLGGAEEGWTWTTAKVVAFEFTAPTAPADLEFALDASGFTSTAHPAGQRATLVVNGDVVGHATFDDSRQVLKGTIPRATWNARTPCTIRIDLPDAISPAELGESDDRRVLGLRIYRLSVRPAAKSS